MSVLVSEFSFSTNDIVQRANAVRHSHVFVPKTNEYVQGFLREPVAACEYQQSIEPVVDLKGFNDPTGTAWLTVNHYNAVVLNTRNMMIADIDFGDTRLNPFAGAKDAGEVIDTLNDLATLDAEFQCEHDFGMMRFADHTYRVYETHSGCRVICTSVPFPMTEQEYAARKLMQFLRADRQYMALCDTQGCFRARLTPKPWRDNGCDPHVCNLLEQIGNDDVHPDLQGQLALHDEMTLRKSRSSSLA